MKLLCGFVIFWLQYVNFVHSLYKCTKKIQINESVESKQLNLTVQGTKYKNQN